MNILFVEDDESLLTSGIEQLEMLGHTVVPSKSLKCADEILARPNLKFHLVIADHALPDGPGIDFAIKVKREHPGLFVTVVSGCLTDRDIARLQEEELAYFLKPLLYRKVLDHVRREKMAGKPVSAGPPPDGSGEALPVEKTDGPEAFGAKNTGGGLSGFFKKKG